jgi:hypothetical protein
MIEDVAQVSVMLLAVGLGSFYQAVDFGAGGGAFWHVAKSQFLRPIMKGRMARSAALLSIS